MPALALLQTISRAKFPPLALYRCATHRPQGAREGQHFPSSLDHMRTRPGSVAAVPVFPVVSRPHNRPSQLTLLPLRETRYDVFESLSPAATTNRAQAGDPYNLQKVWAVRLRRTAERSGPSGPQAPSTVQIHSVEQKASVSSRADNCTNVI